jgi:hypothetical protein
MSRAAEEVVKALPFLSGLASEICTHYNENHHFEKGHAGSTMLLKSLPVSGNMQIALAIMNIKRFTPDH